MNRPCALTVTAFLICFLKSTHALDAVLTTATLDDSSDVSLISSGETLSLSIRGAGSESRIQNLKSKIQTKSQVTVSQSKIQNPKSKIELLSFELSAGSISVLLVRQSATWSVAGEWSVERHDDGDAGSKNETQKWTIDNGDVKREVHRFNVEGIEYTLPCGCCKAIQTRTIETVEETNFTWSDAKQTLEQQSFKKWYVVQYGEGLFSVARKALGDARLMGKVLVLNPELKLDAVLTTGQKILIEKE